MVAFTQLPAEILHLILENCEVPCLLGAQLVSKQVRGIVLDSSRLQYTLALAKSRLSETYSQSLENRLGYATRLSLHRRREKAWRMLNYADRQSLSLLPGTVYELKNNLYASGTDDQTGRTSSITFYDLPKASYASGGKSGSEGPAPSLEKNSWTHATHDFAIRDITLDPGQDLLVFVTAAPQQSPSVYEIHLRTLSTNVPHPFAMSPTLPCSPRPNVNPLNGNMPGNGPNPATMIQGVLHNLVNNLTNMMNQGGLPNAAPQPPPAPANAAAPAPAPFPGPNPGAPLPAPPVYGAPLPPPLPPPQVQNPQQLVANAVAIPFPFPNPNMVNNMVNANLPPIGNLFPPNLGIDMLGSVRVQLLDSRIALLVQLPLGGTHLVIWDWKKGETVVGCSITLLGGIDDFCFVTANSFLIVTPHGKFELYRFDLLPVDTPETPANGSAIRPTPYFSSRNQPSAAHLLIWKTRYPVLVARYSLPLLSEGFNFASFSISSNPLVPNFHAKETGISTTAEVFAKANEAAQNDGASQEILEGSQSQPSSSPARSPHPILQTDNKFTHTSSRSRILACSLTVLRNEPFHVALQWGGPLGPGGILPVHIGPGHVGQAGFAIPPLNGGQGVGHAGPGQAAAPPPAPPGQGLFPGPAPVANAPGQLGGAAPVIAVPDAENNRRPSARPFVFFTDVGMFIRDLELYEREQEQKRLQKMSKAHDVGSYPLSLHDPEDDDVIPDVSPSAGDDDWDANVPFDIMICTPRYSTPTDTLPSDSPEREQRQHREKLRHNFKAQTGTLHPRQVPWKEWGVENTRWFADWGVADWQHAVYGTRVVESVPAEKIEKRGLGRTSRNVSTVQVSSSDSAEATMSVESSTLAAEGENTSGSDGEDTSRRENGKKKVLVLRDFNPYSTSNPRFYLDPPKSSQTLRDSQAKGKAKNKDKATEGSISASADDTDGNPGGRSRRNVKWGSIRIVKAPSTLRAKGFFKDDIVSGLPYTEVVSEETYEVNTAMIDDEHILLVTPKNGTSGMSTELDILTF